MGARPPPVIDMTAAGAGASWVPAARLCRMVAHRGGTAPRLAAAMLMGLVAPCARPQGSLRGTAVAAARDVACNRATTRSPIRLLAPQAGG